MIPPPKKTSASLPHLSTGDGAVCHQEATARSLHLEELRRPQVRAAEEVVVHDLRHNHPVVPGLLALPREVAVGAEDAEHARPEQGRHERVVDELGGDVKIERVRRGGQVAVEEYCRTSFLCERERTPVRAGRRSRRCVRALACRDGRKKQRTKGEQRIESTNKHARADNQPSGGPAGLVHALRGAARANKRKGYRTRQLGRKSESGDDVARSCLILRPGARMHHRPPRQTSSGRQQNDAEEQKTKPAATKQKPARQPAVRHGTEAWHAEKYKARQQACGQSNRRRFLETQLGGGGGGGVNTPLAW